MTPIAIPRQRNEKATQLAHWTVLAYLAGDNDLEGAAIEDIN